MNRARWESTPPLALRRLGAAACGSRGAEGLPAALLGGCRFGSCASTAVPLEGVLQPGVHWMLDALLRLQVDVVSILGGWLIHPELELMVKSGRFGKMRVVDLKTHQRAIVWADGRLPRARPDAGAS